jgi:hypothetical protein
MFLAVRFYQERSQGTCRNEFAENIAIYDALALTAFFFLRKVRLVSAFYQTVKEPGFLSDWPSMELF